MSKITVKISITGTKPILINTFPIDTLDEGKAKSGTTGKDESTWKRNVLMTANRELYVLPSYIIGSIVNGGKNIKVGKGSLSKKVGSSLECSPEIILLDGLKVPPEKEVTTNASDDVYIDVRSVLNPMTKGRNVRYRIAAKPGWKLSAMISWDDAQVSFEQMKQSLVNGGLYEGIGDGRKIGFGRFKVIKFELLDD